MSRKQLMFSRVGPFACQPQFPHLSELTAQPAEFMRARHRSGRGGLRWTGSHRPDPEGSHPRGHTRSGRPGRPGSQKRDQTDPNMGAQVR